MGWALLIMFVLGVLVGAMAAMFGTS